MPDTTMLSRAQAGFIWGEYVAPPTTEWTLVGVPAVAQTASDSADLVVRFDIAFDEQTFRRLEALSATIPDPVVDADDDL